MDTSRISGQETPVASTSTLLQPYLNESDKISTDNDIVIAVVRNIPQRFHSKDLRYYFAEFVDNGYFRCFHFRHRPEIQINEQQVQDKKGNSGSSRCCLVSFNSAELREKFKDTFHGQFWMDAQGNQLLSRCYIFNVKLDDTTGKNDELLSRKELSEMIEFRPPSLMPFGNVGTPSGYFLEQIRLCKLPASLIGKLGLRPQKRVGKYGAVPLDYFSNTTTDSDAVEPESGKPRELDAVAAECITIGKCSEEDHLSAKTSNAEGDNDSHNDIDGEDCDEDECEEWERHEALHDDVTEQDRTKPKKYEEEMEVVWEKGGPGLVWYTDTFYWNETEQGTDTDWKWADDWDVDYSVYYDRSGCSLDAKQAVEIRNDEKLRNGEVTESVFKKKEEKMRKRRYSDSGSDRLSFGCFEKYTKGIGSKLMKRYGWEPGKGLGRHCTGKINAASAEIEEAGSSQFSGQKVGFGYHGEKIARTGFYKPEQHRIATIYDIEKAKADPSFVLEERRDPVLRSKSPTYMKYR